MRRKKTPTNKNTSYNYRFLAENHGLRCGYCDSCACCLRFDYKPHQCILKCKILTLMLFFLFFIGKVLLLWSIKRLPKNPKNTQQYYGTVKCSKHWCFSLSLLSLFIWHVWVSFADPNCSPCQFSNKLYVIHLFIAYGKNITDGNLCK